MQALGRTHPGREPSFGFFWMAGVSLAGKFQWSSTTGCRCSPCWVYFSPQSGGHGGKNIGRSPAQPSTFRLNFGIILPLNRSLKSLQMRPGAPKQRYSPLQRPRGGNRIRLMAVVRLFRLSPSEIGKATGYSRSYVSRLLNPKDEFSGSREFFRTVECKLGQIIDQRASQFFTVPAVSVARARGVLEQLPVEQAAMDSEMARAA
jgi:hypothetical protein